MTQQAQIAARQLYRSGRLREALEAFRTLTDSEPADPQHWQFRAMTEQQVGSLEEARSSIARAIALDELRPEPHLVAGHIAEDLGDFERAEAGCGKPEEARDLRSRKHVGDGLAGVGKVRRGLDGSPFGPLGP